MCIPTLYVRCADICCVGFDNYEELLTQLWYNLVDLIKPNVPCDPSKLAELVAEVRKYYFASLPSDASKKDGFEKIIEVQTRRLYLESSLRERKNETHICFYQS